MSIELFSNKIGSTLWDTDNRSTCLLLRSITFFTTLDDDDDDGSVNMMGRGYSVVDPGVFSRV